MKRTSLALAVGIFLVVAVGLLLVSPRMGPQMQAGFLQLISPFLRTGSTLETKISAFTQSLKTLQELETENSALATENRQLRATHQLLKELESENARLRGALAYRERSKFKLVPARILARDASTWWSTVKIDRGFEDGLDTDQPVITDGGLVGKTTTVARNISMVLLVADESCKVAALVEGTPERGIVSGERVASQMEPLLQLSFLSRDTGVQPGHRVLTSGAGGVFPDGLLVGTIKEFHRRELDGRAVVRPAVDLGRLQEVFVIVGRKQ
jgi:rod shape-determining protein MreC